MTRGGRKRTSAPTRARRGGQGGTRRTRSAPRPFPRKEQQLHERAVRAAAFAMHMRRYAIELNGLAVEARLDGLVVTFDVAPPPGGVPADATVRATVLLPVDPIDYD